MRFISRHCSTRRIGGAPGFARPLRLGSAKITLHVGGEGHRRAVRFIDPATNVRSVQGRAKIPLQMFCQVVSPWDAG